MSFKEKIKNIIPESVFYYYHTVSIIFKNLEFVKKKNYNNWISNGKPLPPPHAVKQKTIREYTELYKPETLVETGTFLGEMVYSQRNNFKKIISIELSPKLHANAVRRFKNQRNVEILLGDSSKVLKELAASGKLNEPCLFWLDGHYSAGFTALGEKETPIMEELDSIFSTNQNHIILIDDARCFTGKNDYPTIDELKQFIKGKSSGYEISISDDIIKIIDKNRFLISKN